MGGELFLAVTGHFMAAGWRNVDLSWILFSLIFAQFFDGFGDHELTMGRASLTSLAIHGHRRTDSAAPWCILVILALHGLGSGLA
jgi:hypothetical protein